MHYGKHVITIAGSLLFAGFGCGHSHAETQALVASNAQPATPAAAPDAGAAMGSSEQGSAIQPEPITNFMPDHFWIVSWARDEVIDGDLEALRKPLRSLADYTYETVLPGSWMRNIGQLQAAARVVADAENLSAAAAGVATMTRICGQCHEEHGHRLELYPAPVVMQKSKSNDISARMHRHAWASKRLWEGLMAPSDQLWQAGADALAHAPLKAPPIGAFTSKDFAESLARLRDLGTRASQAVSAEHRANIYANILATCAQCHADTAIAGL